MRGRTERICRGGHRLARLRRRRRRGDPDSIVGDLNLVGQVGKTKHSLHRDLDSRGAAGGGSRSLTLSR